MFKALKNSAWLTGSLILLTPLMLFFFLASQMAYSQVQSRFADYQNITEVTQAADMAGLSAGETVFVRGRLSEATCRLASPSVCDYQPAGGLIVYQERPAGGREVRFQEKFNQFFPSFVLDLADRQVIVVPSSQPEHIIRAEPHRVLEGDRELTGFKVGDAVLVQGQWQPGEKPTLRGVTGISGGDKQSLMAEFETGFQLVGWARNIFGLLTVLGLFLLISRRRRLRQKQTEEVEEWGLQDKKTTAQTTSPS
jgi:hypothetical protein